MDKLIEEDLQKIISAIKTEVYANKKVLVSGGAGFIGSWICDVLLRCKAEVTAIDDLSTGRMANISHLTQPGFSFIESDVCTFNSEKKFDFIFHLAAHASPDEYQSKPIETLRTGSLGTTRMAELAQKNKATILFASTSEVYGDSEVIPTPESYLGKVSSIGPRSCYDEGKRYGEALLMAYYKQYALDIKIPRIFNTYGPRLREDGLYGRVISRFILQALSNEPLTVYGDGKQTRSFCYVTDTVKGLLQLAATKKSTAEAVNIGNTQEVTILELAEKIKNSTNCKSTIEFHPFPKDDPRRRRPEIAKIKSLIGWKPEVSFDQGIERTITWFNKNKQS